MRNIIIFLVLIGICFVGLLYADNDASAHGLAASFRNTVGSNIVEFEYDTTGNVIAGELTNFGFELLANNEKDDQVPYERVSVKFTPVGGLHPVFAANILPVDVFGRKASRVNITISESGHYTAELVFYNNGAELVRSSFPFEVVQSASTATTSKQSGRKTLDIFVFACMGICILAQGVWIYTHRKV